MAMPPGTITIHSQLKKGVLNDLRFGSSLRHFNCHITQVNNTYNMS